MTTSSLASLSPASPLSSASPQTPDGFYVLCLYDFPTEDPDQLSFAKGSILRIVQTEETGWWAALDPTGSKIGWVPQEFVQPMSDEMAQTYAHVTEEIESARASQPDFEFSPLSSPFTPESAIRDELQPRFSSELTFSPNTALTPPGNPINSTPVTAFWQAGRPDSVQDAAAARERLAKRVSRRMTLSSEISSMVPPSPRAPVPLPTPDHGYATAAPNGALPPIKLDPPPGVVGLPARPAPERAQTIPLQINKPTPPTPTAPPAVASLAHPETPVSALRSPRARPTPIISRDPSLFNRISMALDGPSPGPARSPGPRHAPSASMSSTSTSADTHSLSRSFDDLDIDESSQGGTMSDSGAEGSVRRRAAKVGRVTGDEDAQAFVNALEAQARLPRFLRPTYVQGDDIKLEYDGSVRAGTILALVERLTVDPLRLDKEKAFRRTFLLTFKSFTSADMLFGLLEDRFRIDHPSDLTDDEFQEWRDKKLKPTQTRVLVFMREWLEEHHMLQEDPQIAPRLRDFLTLIKSPPDQALTAKLTLQSLDRLTSTPPKDPYEPRGASPQHKFNSKKSKGLTTDILKHDSVAIAQQLTLLEARLYARVRPSECLAWARRGGTSATTIKISGGTVKGDAISYGTVTNLLAFCATNDKLASWVKMSVLDREGLGKRADTIDQWIRVAEKCRQLNNISSMSAILAALSSVDVSRLNLTWAHVGRMSQFQALNKLTDPSGNFKSYRDILSKVEGPCVPFIGMYLSDLVHYNDRFDDTVGPPPSAQSPPPPSAFSPAAQAVFSPGASKLSAFSPSASTSSLPASAYFSAGKRPLSPAPPAAPPDAVLVNFVKRQYIAQVIDATLRHQARPYALPEDAATLGYAEHSLALAAKRDQGGFWLRSQEVQQAEVAHADIRRGLEQAGF